jgi:toxin ParE1/3/4
VLVIRRPAAELDIEELAFYIAQSHPSAASDFLESVYWTCELLAGMPRLGASYRRPRRELNGLRRHPVRDFHNHLIFYRPIREGIEVVRVLHGARDLASMLKKTRA